MESANTGIKLPCWNVKNILDSFPLLGVPHFQRGLVWQNDAVSLLLESLYFGTPCGTIILWKTKVGCATEYGLPLQASAKTPQYLIVDGQQRIRSLWNVFKEDVGEEAEPFELEDQTGTEEEEQTDELEEDAKRTWCLNLGRVPQLAAEFRGGKRFPLFRYAKLPSIEMNSCNTRENNGKARRPDPTRYDREALFPLYLLKDDSAVSRILSNKEDPLQKSVSAVRRCTRIWQQLEQMSLEPLFYVVTLKEDKGLKEVVEVYNRINSAGKRVEKEERAFANVVFVSTSINKTLADFFGSVHPAINRQRDAQLARTKERSFGFKLFMRTFVQVWAYHSWRSIGSSGLSFNSVTPDSLSDFGNGHADDLSQILNETKNILIYLRNVLRNNLFCDDLRMLPDTKALWPIIQLLIRYPQLQEQQKIVAWLLFRLMLGNANRRTLLELVAKLDDSDDSKQALEILQSAIGPPPTFKQLIGPLKNARSLNNRHTLMLYWILRFRKACDFAYSVNSPKMSGKPKPLAEQCEPSKQHIIPYGYLKDILSGLKRRGRISSHEANDIGNLTYISGEQNGWANLGGRPLKLSDEPLCNRGSHMLETAANEKRFRAACDVNASESHRRDQYERFCNSRRRTIGEAFIEFERDLWRKASSALNTQRIRDPKPRLIHPDKGQKIRDLPYPLAVKLPIRELIRLRGKRSEGFEDGTQDEELSLAFIAPSAKGSKNTRIAKVTFATREIRLKLKDRGMVAQMRRKFASVDVTLKNSGWSEFIVPVQSPYAGDVLNLLQKQLNSRMRHKKGKTQG